ncbi:MAG: protein kinase, partial [Planctomycetota bacterium]
GIHLQKFIGRGRKFTTAEIIHLGLSVTHALKTAWDSPAKIIHRDIKPSNIMVSFSSSVISSAPPRKDQPESLALLDFDITEARIKVMDFGLAKLFQEEKDATMVGTIIGTPKYISPEQGLGNPVDIRTDIYSLGIVLYEMATGKIPFESETAMSLIRHHIYDTPLAPSRINPELPARLETIIIKCIQKDPNQRYLTPDQLIADLEAMKQQTPVYASKTTSTGTSDTPTIIPIFSKKKRKLSLLTVSMITLGVILFMVGGIIILALIADKIKQQNHDLDRLNGLLVRAEILLQTNDLQKAEEVLNEASSLSPDSPRLKELSNKLTGQKNTRDTQEKLNNYLPQARQHLKAGNLVAARQVLNEASSLAPGNAEINNLLAELKQKEDQLQTKKPNKPDEDEIPVKTNEKKWTSNRWGFEVTLPDEWQMKIFDKENEGQIAEFYDKNYTVEGLIMMDKSESDCDEYLDNMLDNLKSSSPAELINESGGQEEATITYTTMIDKIKYQYYIRVINVSGLKLRFAVWTKAKFYPKYQKTIEKYAQTLKGH